MTYVLIWIIFAPAFTSNVAATGSAEFGDLPSCQRAAQAIATHISGSRVEVTASCHEKGRQQ